jgi:hypothetical protein
MALDDRLNIVRTQVRLLDVPRQDHVDIQFERHCRCLHAIVTDEHLTMQRRQRYRQRNSETASSDRRRERGQGLGAAKSDGKCAIVKLATRWRRRSAT